MPIPLICPIPARCPSCGGAMLGRAQTAVHAACVPEPWAPVAKDPQVYAAVDFCGICDESLQGLPWTGLHAGCASMLVENRAPKDLVCGRPSLTGVLAQKGCGLTLPVSEFSMRASGPARICKACERARKNDDTRIDAGIEASLAMGSAEWSAQRYVNRFLDVAGIDAVEHMARYALREVAKRDAAILGGGA